MKIAMCGDTEDCEARRKILKRESQRYVCSVYENLESVRDAVQKGENFELLVMDVDVKEHDWLDVLEQICEKATYIRIIFVTSYPGKYIEQMSLRRINFGGVVKRKNVEENLPKLVNRLKNKSYDSEYFIMHHHGNVFVESYDDIVYLECSGHTVFVHCIDKTYKLYTSMSKIEKGLPHEFNRCHKSFSVNMKHVKRIEGQEIELTSEDIIFMNKSRMKSFKDAYEEYLKNR